MDFFRGRSSLAVAVGAIAGALTRFYITEFAKAILGQDFGFYGTFFINISGCLLIAYILTLALEQIRELLPELRLMTTTGFCGAYTTFSTYNLEAKEFLDNSDFTTLLFYWVGSAVLGMVAVKLGVLLARLNAQSI